MGMRGVTRLLMTNGVENIGAQAIHLEVARIVCV